MSCTLKPPCREVAAAVGLLQHGLPTVRVAIDASWLAGHHGAVVVGRVQEGRRPVRTTAAGDASSGGWTLGTTAGQQTLDAAVDGIPAVTFTATASPGPLAQIVAATAMEQETRVNTPVPVLPSVRAVDLYDNPIAGTAVTFTVVQGNGTITGAQQSTNDLGRATVGAWTAGTAIGQQILSATASGVAAANFSVIALAGPPADLLKFAGDALKSSPGSFLLGRP